MLADFGGSWNKSPRAEGYSPVFCNFGCMIMPYFISNPYVITRMMSFSSLNGVAARGISYVEQRVRSSYYVKPVVTIPWNIRGTESVQEIILVQSGN